MARATRLAGQCGTLARPGPLAALSQWHCQCDTGPARPGRPGARLEARGRWAAPQTGVSVRETLRLRRSAWQPEGRFVPRTCPSCFRTGPKLAPSRSPGPVRPDQRHGTAARSAARHGGRPAARHGGSLPPLALVSFTESTAASNSAIMLCSLSH